ncbi:AAA family ATPase [Dyadobacter crusticola]|uniref:AAA family ATPase n=1 Tax=Dyadobacter crusticola TaxID=292407 RepID=UPI00068BC75F|nr:AAA family ATPase [Dyadobacter crusticola]
MIREIDIKRFGLFDEYDWNSTIGKTASFRRLNIIYGRNYSGKTTLSRIFKCIENGCLHKHHKDAVFSITLDSGQLIDQSNFDIIDKAIKIRVYNTDFVKENLSWIHNDEEGTIEPFTILGASNVELDKQIQEIEIVLGIWRTEMDCLRLTR